MVSVAKASKHKTSIGGRKYALRRRNESGVAQAEVIGIGRPPVDDGDDRALLVPLVVDGEIDASCTGPAAVLAAKARHRASFAELPPVAHRLQRGEPAIPTEYEQEEAVA
jgi:nicotinate phosphoribosyltransferase